MIQLTNESIKRLPDEMPITVTWSGGNGPHQYALRRVAGRPYACAYVRGRGQNIGWLDNIGEHPLTQVWVEENRWLK